MPGWAASIEAPMSCCRSSRKGKAAHVNNVELGRHGRWRSNVWTYPGASSIGSDAQQGLRLHPTVKPVAMIGDALLDLTRRGDIVLDPFLGSGSTVIAAEKSGRACYGAEVDPLVCRRRSTSLRSSRRLQGRACGRLDIHSPVHRDACRGSIAPRSRAGTLQTATSSASTVGSAKHRGTGRRRPTSTAPRASPSTSRHGSALALAAWLSHSVAQIPQASAQAIS